MIDEKDIPCDCKIKGKEYDENDKTCIECKRAKRVLEVLFRIAIKKAVDDGDMSLLDMLMDSK